MGGTLLITAKNIIETAEKMLINAREGDVAFNSAKGINYSSGERLEYGKYEEIPFEKKNGKLFEDGFWTNHKDEPIKRAVYGQQLKFHIKMNKSYANVGDEIEFGLYDDDLNPYNSDIKKADDKISLIYSDSKKTYNKVKINSDYTAIIAFSTSDNLEQFADKLDNDKLYELYFRCTYKYKNKTENVELPWNPKAYLKLGTIVIDRYKMPGLNATGTDIADDMTFGTGNNHSLPIYPAEVIAQYKEEYKLSGFSTSQHGVFSNANDFDFKPLMKEKEEEEKPRFSILIEELPKTEIDNTRVVINNGISPIKSINLNIASLNKNRKARYSRDECYNTSYKIKIPLYFTQLEIPISTGFDVRVFDKLLDDNKLFWNFKNTAEFYFARGEMQDNFDRLVAKFKSNEGGIYEDEVLTRNIREHPETIVYCQKVEDYIAEQLKNNFSKLEEVEDKEPYFLVGEDFRNNKALRKDIGKDKFSKPMYSYGNLIEATKGLTIATNDIWSAEVILKEVKFSGDNYTGKYEVTLWDHFGLDKPDMEKIFNVIPSVGEVFVCWFILQHLRGYKPFITKMTLTREFKGNINQDKPIRPVENKTNTNDYSIPKYEHGRIM
jgi:hypothetical protein